MAAWQLFSAGWSRWMIRHCVRTHGWRVVHRGVYALSAAPLRPRQLWIAATLTTPDSVLSHASAAACEGFRPWRGRFEIVTRPGSGGRRRHGAIVVCRSVTLAGDVTRHDGVPVTTAARTLVDLAQHLSATETGRAFREAVRLGATTVDRVGAAVNRHEGRRGVRALGELCTRYADIPYARTRSNAEARGLEVLTDAGEELPLVNAMIAGEEADLVFPGPKRIIEIDGPQFHRFQDEDDRKARAWRDAGFTVDRLPSGVVYSDPGALVRLARGNAA